MSTSPSSFVTAKLPRLKLPQMPGCGLPVVGAKEWAKLEHFLGDLPPHPPHPCKLDLFLLGLCAGVVDGGLGALH